MKTEFKGFTLIELMVAVAIVGILAAVAVPQFKRYQIRSRKVEGKIRLAELKTAQNGWSAQFDTFASCMNLMGMKRLRGSYFSVGFGVDASIGGASSPNGQSVAKGAPPECLTNTAEETYFFQGFLAVGFPMAPDRAATMAVTGGGGIANSGDAYLAMAHALLGDQLAFSNFPFSQSYAQTEVSTVFSLVGLGPQNVYQMFELSGTGNLAGELLSSITSWCNSQPLTGAFNRGMCLSKLNQVNSMTFNP